MQVATGIEGEGSLRDNLSYVYLKGFAEPEAQRLKLDVSKYDRPCLIDGKVADIAALVALSPDPKPQQVVGHKPAATPQDLERMFNAPSAEYEVEEIGAEVQDTIEADLKNAFPNWNSKSIETASKVVQFLNKTPNKNFKAHQIKSGVSALKKVEADKIKALLSKLVDSGFIAIDGDDYCTIVSSDDEYNW